MVPEMVYIFKMVNGAVGYPKGVLVSPQLNGAHGAHPYTKFQTLPDYSCKNFSMPEKEKKVENEWFDAIRALYLNKKKTILEFGFMTY